MVVKEILDFSETYNPTTFKWDECSLYYLLCEYYGVCDVLIETDYGMILIKKHNIVGHKNNDPFISVYESRGECENSKYIIFLDSIHSISVLL